MISSKPRNKGFDKMSTDRYEEFREKAINSKQMFVDLVNKSENGFKMYIVQALGHESYISYLYVGKNCFELKKDEIRDEVAARYGSFCFEVTRLTKDGDVKYLSYAVPYTMDEFSSSCGITFHASMRHLSFVNLEDAMSYMEWEKNDPDRVQKRMEENSRWEIYSLLDFDLEFDE